jgi:hypothetical protein
MYFLRSNVSIIAEEGDGETDKKPIYLLGLWDHMV